MTLSKHSREQPHPVVNSDAMRSCLTPKQLVAEPFAHDVPSLAGAGIDVVVLQVFVQNFAVPFGDRYLLGNGCDSVPQQLHLLDLLVDREAIESERWKRNGIGHIEPRANCLQHTRRLPRGNHTRSET